MEGVIIIIPIIQLKNLFPRFYLSDYTTILYSIS